MKRVVWPILGVIAAFTFNGCGSDDSGGSPSKGGTGGKKDGGATGGTGGTGATSSGGTGGKAGAGGAAGSDQCQAAPPATDPNACEVCEDENHGECACADQAAACDENADCVAIIDCAYPETDSGDPACSELDAAGAACVLACVAQHPAGKELFLAYEKCVYCQFCAAACDSAEYCSGLDAGSDAGASDAGGDVSTDAGASDATTDSAAD